MADPPYISAGADSGGHPTKRQYFDCLINEPQYSLMNHPEARRSVPRYRPTVGILVTIKSTAHTRGVAADLIGRAVKVVKDDHGLWPYQVENSTQWFAEQDVQSQGRPRPSSPPLAPPRPQSAPSTGGQRARRSNTRSSPSVAVEHVHKGADEKQGRTSNSPGPARAYGSPTSSPQENKRHISGRRSSTNLEKDRWSDSPVTPPLRDRKNATIGYAPTPQATSGPSLSPKDPLNLNNRYGGCINWGARQGKYGMDQKVRLPLGEKIPWVADHNVCESEDNVVIHPVFRHYFDAEGIDSSFKSRGRQRMLPRESEMATTTWIAI